MSTSEPPSTTDASHATDAPDTTGTDAQHTPHIADTAVIGVVTVSDRASAGVYEDRSGPAIVAWLERVLTNPHVIDARVVPDDRDRIEATLVELVDEVGASLVLTTGGTGPAPRDVTPEATESVCEKILPGFGEQMRVASLAQVPTAILSRQTAGVRGHALIVNLPGKPRAIDLCLDTVFAAVPYCVDLVGGAYLTTNEEHIVAFRPAKARRPELAAATTTTPGANATQGES